MRRVTWLRDRYLQDWRRGRDSISAIICKSRWILHFADNTLCLSALQANRILFQFLQFLQFAVLPRKTVSLVSVSEDTLVGAGNARRGIVPMVATMTFRQTQWQATTLLRMAEFCSCRKETLSAHLSDKPACTARARGLGLLPSGRQTGSDFLRMVLRRPKHAFGNNFAERREQRAQTSLRQPTFQSLIRSMVVGADGILGMYKKHFQYLRLQCNIFQVKTNHTTPIAAMPIRVSPIRLHSQRSDCRHDRNAFQIATTVPSTPTPPINWIRRNQML